MFHTQIMGESCICGPDHGALLRFEGGAIPFDSDARRFQEMQQVAHPFSPCGADHRAFAPVKKHGAFLTSQRN
jgi:hypothetical protein